MVVGENVICLDQIIWIERSSVTDAKSVVLDSFTDGSPDTTQNECLNERQLTVDLLDDLETPLLDFVSNSWAMQFDTLHGGIICLV